MPYDLSLLPDKKEATSEYDFSKLPDRAEPTGFDMSKLPDRAEAPKPEPPTRFGQWAEKYLIPGTPESRKTKFAAKVVEAEIGVEKFEREVAAPMRISIEELPETQARAVMGFPGGVIGARDPEEVKEILKTPERTWATRYDQGKYRWEKIVERAYPKLAIEGDETYWQALRKSLATTVAGGMAETASDPMTYISAYTISKALPLALRALPYKAQAALATPLSKLTKAQINKTASLMRVGHTVPEVLAGRMNISTAVKKMNPTETAQFHALLARELRVKANLPKGPKGVSGWMRRMLSPYKAKLGPELGKLAEDPGKAKSMRSFFDWLDKSVYPKEPFVLERTTTIPKDVLSAFRLAEDPRIVTLAQKIVQGAVLTDAEIGSIVDIGKISGIHNVATALGISGLGHAGLESPMLQAEVAKEITGVAAAAEEPIAVEPGVGIVSPEVEAPPIVPAVAPEAVPTEITWRSGTTGELVSGKVSKVKPNGDYLVKTDEGFRTIKPERVLASTELVEELPAEPTYDMSLLPDRAEPVARVAEEAPPAEVLPRVAEEAPDDTAFEAIERRVLDAPDPEARAEYDAMWAELEASEAMVGLGDFPLLDTFDTEDIMLSATQVRAIKGLKREDYPKRFQRLLRSETWIKKGEAGARRRDLADLDLLAERVFTPGGDLYEIGVQIGIDPDVDLPTQLIDALINEAEQWVPKKDRGAKPIIGKPLTGWDNTTLESPSAEALREQQRRAIQTGIPYPGPQPPVPTEATEEFREGIKSPHADAPRPGETPEEFQERIKQFYPGVEAPRPTEPYVAPEAVEAPELREIGYKERLRPARRVFEKIGIRETYEEAFEAEVLLWEELMEFRKAALAQRETTDMSPESSTRIFRFIEKTLSPKEIQGMTAEERAVAEWGMNFFDEWADRLGIPQHKRRENYITHIFETAIAKDLRQRYPLDPDLVKAFDFVSPKQVFMPFLEARIGKTVGLREDFWAALEAYEAKALKVYYYEPLLKKMNEQEKVLPPNASRYVRSFVGRMTNRPLQIDREIQQDMKEFGEAISRLPGGAELGAALGRGNIAGLISYNITGLMYEAYMGLVPATAIKNLGQNSLTIAETGIVNFLQGTKWRMTDEGRAALAKSLVIRSRKIGYLPGVDESYLQGLQSKRRELMMAMFRRADKINVRNAFAAGYTEAKKLGLSDEWAVKRGDEVAAKTQYVYTKLGGAMWSQSSVGRVLSVFTTWPENWLELMIDWGTGKESLVYGDYEKATGDKVGPEGPLARRKQMIRYMMIVGMAMYIEHETELSALTYTGWTSLKSFARMATGELPATQVLGGAAQLVAGSLTGDRRMMKEGINKIRPDRIVSIIRRFVDIANGKKDWLSLFVYTHKKKKKEVGLAP